jgi:predicted lipoprotein with Yx(FWY)xxD motif
VFEDDGTLQHRKIKVPNPIYEWKSDKEIGTIASDGVFQSRVNKGTATIKVID